MSSLPDYEADDAVDGPEAKALYYASSPGSGSKLENVSGAGEKIGIISDSFDFLGGYQSDVANGYLPSNVTIVAEGRPNTQQDPHISPTGDLTDEGRAMAEIVYETAPGAQIYFDAVDNTVSSSVSVAQSFANAVTALQGDGCNIIVDDVTLDAEPFFEQGAQLAAANQLESAIEGFVEKGGDYFTAAGNDGDNYYQATFQPINTLLPGIAGSATAMDFGNDSPYEYVSIDNGTNVNLDLQWDQPFRGIDGSGIGSNYSLAIYVYDSSGNIVASSTTNQVGADPVQALQWKAQAPTNGDTTYRIAVVLNGGTVTPPGTFRFTFIGNSNSISIIDPNAGQGSGDIFGHKLLAGVNSVGAANVSQTPSQGVSPPVIEPYSEAGQVSFTAPDGSQTSAGSGVCNVSFMPFTGTSAAAPVAAAVAALMLQEDTGLTNSQVTEYLKESAIPISASNAGAGLIQADTALGLVSGDFQVTTEIELDGAFRAIGLDSQNQAKDYTISINNSLSLTTQVPLLLLDNSSTVEVDGNGYTIDLGGTDLSLSDGTITLAGVLLTNGGSVSLDNQVVNLVDSRVSLGSLTGLGTYTIDSQSDLSVSGQVLGGSTLSFGSPGGVLTLSDPGQMGGLISGFTLDDTIDLAGVGTATGATLGSNNTLAVAESNGTVATLSLDPSQNYTGDGFIVTSDGNGGTDITVQPEIKVPKGQTVSPSQAAAGSGATIAFGGNSGTVVIPNTQTFDDTVTSFQAGDIIQLPNLQSPYVTLLVDQNDQALLIENYPSPYFNQSFEIKLGSFNNYYDQYGNSTPENYDFDIGLYNGNYIITTMEMLQSPACYLRSTLISTPSGETSVEALTIGDLVLTASGDARPIKWIGRRAYLPRFFGGNRALWPICFKAGSLGNGLPRRDLCVSGEHAMFIDGLLISARHLVNGTTITRERPTGDLLYFHIELETHDVILAEGAPAETFLDDDSRKIFHNAAEFAALYPKADRPGRFCAPRVEGGYEVEAVRRRLNALAGEQWQAA